MSTSSYAIRDSATMLRRQLLHIVRYPGMTFGVLLIPVFMLLIFRYVFGATLGAGLGAGTGGYINFLTPGIIVLAVTSASVATAVSVNTDMTEGIINRFRTMPIARVSVLTGHVLGSVIQTMAAAVVITVLAVAFGFRPSAGVAGWLGAIGLVRLHMGVGGARAARQEPRKREQLPPAAGASAVPGQCLRPCGRDGVRAALVLRIPAVHAGHRHHAQPAAWYTRGRAAARVRVVRRAGAGRVTVRAVRHYHQRGLLPEPERDASGYRRYDADAVISLIRIKALADAGVPLAQIRELLAAGPAEFADAVAGIDKAMAARIRALQAQRHRIAQLVAGDRLFVPAEIADLFDLIRSIGISPQQMQIERDAWILLAARFPGQAREWARDKLNALADPEFQAIYRAYYEAYDWDPG